MRFPFHLKREMRDKYFRLPVELFSCVFRGKREWCGASELGHSLQLHRLPVSFSPFLCFAKTCHSASPRPRSRTHTKTPFGGKREKNKKNFVSHRVRISECKPRQRERGVIECWHWVAVSTGLQQGQSYTHTQTQVTNGSSEPLSTSPLTKQHQEKGTCCFYHFIGIRLWDVADTANRTQWGWCHDNNIQQ